ncbi:MAG: HDOD domain-containing protein [Burkholderiales bacterium]|nr:MAG: HDOD domain-containing protein [Burkholderiales bacterium]
MSALILWISAVLALALLWWAFRRKPRSTAPAAVPRTATTPRQPPQEPLPPPALRQGFDALAVAVPARQEHRAAAPDAEPPAELAALAWRRLQDLDADRRAALTEAIRGIPRPPRSMQQLLSPEFVARADSSQLADLVMTEPLIAAKVLGAVNSPRYGLQRPISHLGQAVTFLGMNTVRSICLQYMLAEAFKPGHASARQAFDALWRACGLASELAVHLGKAMNLPQQAGLATQVVLGFVGQLASASLLPADQLKRWMDEDRIGRARLEQDLIGLNACELGQLLMHSWSLPAGLIEDVGDSGRVLVTPVSQVDTTRAPTLGLASLCHHLGEHPADAHTADSAGLMDHLSGRADTFHLAGYLAHPGLARLPAALASAEVQACLDRVLDAPENPGQAEPQALPAAA